MLACKVLVPAVFPSLVTALASDGFKPRSGEAFLAYQHDPVLPAFAASCLELAEFVSQCASKDVRVSIANFRGPLAELCVDLGIVLDFGNRVLVVSVADDVLWTRCEAKPKLDIHRLRAFFAVCETVSALVSPSRGYMGTELLHRDEIRLGQAQSPDMSTMDDEFFSEARLMALASWYEEEYATRWKYGRSSGFDDTGDPSARE